MGMFGTFMSTLHKYNNKKIIIIYPRFGPNRTIVEMQILIKTTKVGIFVLQYTTTWKIIIYKVRIPISIDLSILQYKM